MDHLKRNGQEISRKMVNWLAITLSKGKKKRRHKGREKKEEFKRKLENSMNAKLEADPDSNLPNDSNY